MAETVGSQKLIQSTVERSAQLIDPDLRAHLGLPNGAEIEWRSPLSVDGFKEYRDAEVLKLLELTLPKRSLDSFWPGRGPVWDALARTSTGQIILVEAKAHIPELASPGTRAEGPSLGKIEAAFNLVRAGIAPHSPASWTSTFYQYASRLAFLYLLRANDIDAHLVHVLFLNAEDVRGPAAVEAWQGALELLRAALGLQSHKLKPFVHELFIDARAVTTTTHPDLVV